MIKNHEGWVVLGSPKRGSERGLIWPWRSFETGLVVMQKCLSQFVTSNDLQGVIWPHPLAYLAGSWKTLLFSTFFNFGSSDIDNLVLHLNVWAQLNLLISMPSLNICWPCQIEGFHTLLHRRPTWRWLLSPGASWCPPWVWRFSARRFRPCCTSAGRTPQAGRNPHHTGTLTDTDQLIFFKLAVLKSRQKKCFDQRMTEQDYVTPFKAMLTK